MTERKKINPHQDALVIAAGFLLIFLITKKAPFLYTAFAVAALGGFSDFAAQKISWAWNKLAMMLGFISSHILLSVIYFLLHTPLAFFFRMKHKNFFQLKKKTAGSYFTERNHQYTAKDLEKMW